jgi:hypothetical protein
MAGSLGFCLRKFLSTLSLLRLCFHNGHTQWGRIAGKILSRIAGAGDEISTIMKQFALHQEKMQKEKHTLHSNICRIRGILESCDLDSNKLQDALALLASIEDVVVWAGCDREMVRMQGDTAVKNAMLSKVMNNVKWKI